MTKRIMRGVQVMIQRVEEVIRKICGSVKPAKEKGKEDRQ
jgi:hypothetical protein